MVYVASISEESHIQRIYYYCTPMDCTTMEREKNKNNHYTCTSGSAFFYVELNPHLIRGW